MVTSNILTTERNFLCDGLTAAERWVTRRGGCQLFGVLLLALVTACRGPQIAQGPAGYAETQRVAERSLRPSGVEKSAVQQTQFVERFEEPSSLLPGAAGKTETRYPPDQREPLPTPSDDAARQPYPVDLPTALRLAGANNLQIAFAAERVNQAAARADAARVLWIPSLQAGVVYNNHAGRIQATEGDVIEASRNSLFVGAGAVAGTSATTGGAGGPARMVVDLPLVDVLFEPLAARQVVQAAAADQAATFNDTLLAVSLAYLDLARAQHLRTVAEEAVRNAEELAGLTADFARAGQGLQADAGRAQVELGARRRNVLRAEEAVAVASAELARLLRLDPSVRLQAVDQQPMPLELVAEQVPLPQLIDQAIAGRPEVARSEAVVGETSARLQQERWRPWTPHLHAGFSTGGFGGGQSSAVKNFSDRTDFDAAAVWEWQNLGFGNRAQQREQDSLHRQAFLAADQTRDLVATEVTQAYERLQSRHRQIEVARPQVQLAREALRQNLEGIRGGVLRPIEIQQALGALAAARQQYLDAVTDYNRAQLEMLRSLGTPPNVASEATPHP